MVKSSDISFKPISNGGRGGQNGKKKAGACGASLLKIRSEERFRENAKSSTDETNRLISSEPEADSYVDRDFAGVSLLKQLQVKLLAKKLADQNDRKYEAGIASDSAAMPMSANDRAQMCHSTPVEGFYVPNSYWSACVGGGELDACRDICERWCHNSWYLPSEGETACQRVMDAEPSGPSFEE